MGLTIFNQQILIQAVAWEAGGLRGPRSPNILFRGGRNIAWPPLKTDMVTLCKGFSNFSHHMYVHFKVKI